MKSFIKKSRKSTNNLYIKSNIFELHGTSRFDIYYNRYIHSCSVIENIHVVIAGICSFNYSILHLYVFIRTL